MPKQKIVRVLITELEDGKSSSRNLTVYRQSRERIEKVVRAAIKAACPDAFEK